MEDNTRSLLFGAIAFFAGLVVGVGIGILAAPQSGSRTRRQLQNMLLDAQEEAESLVKDTKEAVSDLVERGKKIVSKTI